MDLETLIKKPLNFIKEALYVSRNRKIATFLIFSVFAILVGLGASGVRFAYKVNYGGEVIATVKDKAQFEAAVNIVKEKVSAEEREVEEKVEEPEYIVAVVLNNNIDTEDVVAEAIIEKTEEIVEGYEVLIEGVSVAYLSDASINNYVETRKNSFITDAENTTAEYMQNIEVVKGYYVTDSFGTFENAAELINAVPVKTVTTAVSELQIKNKTVTQKNAEMKKGETKVLTEGSDGLRKLTEAIVAVNGEETERVTVSDEVITEPVDKVVEVGTALDVASANEIVVAKNSGFLFPLPKGSFRVSAYYGDGRNHKGVDICAPKGTDVFAVAAGRVVKATSHRSYGNYIDIDHGNGIVTRYAHNSALLVSVGDTVGAGDIIAKVGSTGRSTANHLHFEVMVGGRNANPAPYLGLG